MKCCKDCTERYLGCHDHCERYRETKAEYERSKAQIKNGMEYRRYVVSRSFKRRDDDALNKKRHSGYSKFKGHH